MAYPLARSEPSNGRVRRGGKRPLAYGYLPKRKMRKIALRRLFFSQLRRAAAEADAGRTIDATGKSDQEFLAILQR